MHRSRQVRYDLDEFRAEVHTLSRYGHERPFGAPATTVLRANKPTTSHCYFAKSCFKAVNFRTSLA